MDLSNSIPFFIGAFSSLFTIVNPFSTASVFLTITKGESNKKRKDLAKRATITAFFVLIVFALAGNLIMNFFSISIDAIKISGGLIVAGIGFKMVSTGREHFHSEEEKKEAVNKEDVSIIPLAIPMLSGPGAMTTSIVLMGNTTNLVEKGFLLLAIIFVSFISYIILVNADKVDDRIGEIGKKVISKIMGLIVLVVGIQFIINGVHGVLVSWFPTII